MHETNFKTRAGTTTLCIANRYKTIFLASLLLSLAWSVSAQAATCPADNLGVHAEFIEGAPTDRLVLRHTSPAGWQITAVSWNLSSSKGKVFFDVTDKGAGVEVFQPLRIVSKGDNAAKLAEPPVIKDGDQQLVMRFSQFTGQQQFAVTMDVDDQLGGREITVNSSEMSGAMLDVTFQGPADAEQRLTATFDGNARAMQCEALKKSG
jgi:hypothetical protein